VSEEGSSVFSLSIFSLCACSVLFLGFPPRRCNRSSLGESGEDLQFPCLPFFFCTCVTSRSVPQSPCVFFPAARDFCPSYRLGESLVEADGPFSPLFFFHVAFLPSQSPALPPLLIPLSFTALCTIPSAPRSPPFSFVPPPLLRGIILM